MTFLDINHLCIANRNKIEKTLTINIFVNHLYDNLNIILKIDGSEQKREIK